MATDKLFSVAGTSKHAGEYKVRFANDSLRVKILAKNGHENINLVELPNEMTKLEAVLFIKGLDEFSGVNEQAAIADYLDRNSKAPKTQGPAAKTTKAPKTKAAPTMDAIKAKAKAKVDMKELEAAVGLAPDLEDQPFGTVKVQ